MSASIWSPYTPGVISTDQVTYLQGSAGSVSRTITSKLQEVVSVKDFGAIGDGVADDTLAIQAAISAAVSSGFALTAPPGVYLLSDALRITSPTLGFALRGAGKGVTTFKKTSAVRAYAIYVEGGEDIELTDFTLDVNFTELGDAFGGISVYQCSDVLLRNIEILDIADDGAGILVYTGGVENIYKNVVIEGCVQRGNTVAGNGFLLGDMLYSGIRNCYVEGTRGAPGIGLQLKNAARYCFIENSIAYDCAQGAALGSDGASTTGPEYCRINDISIRACSSPFVIYDGSYNHCNGLLIDQVGAAVVSNSIDIRSTSYTPVRNIITNAVIYGQNALRDAVRIRNGSEHVVEVSFVERLGAGSNFVFLDAGTSTCKVIISSTSPNDPDITARVTDNGTDNQICYTWVADRFLRTDSSDRLILYRGSSLAPTDTNYLFRLDSDADVRVQLANGAAATVSGMIVSVPTEKFKATFTYNITGQFWDFGLEAASYLRMFTTTLRPVTDNSYDLGTAGFRFNDIFSTNLRPGAGAVTWTSGTGSPEGSIVAVVGSMYTRTDGGAGTTLYIKETGTGNTGWIAK